MLVSKLDKQFAAVIDPHMRMIESMIPRWCDRLTLKSEDQDASDGSPAACSAHIDYNNAVITFYPTFLIDSPRNQKQYIKHEMFHLVTAWVVEYGIEALREVFVGNTAAERIVVQEYKNRVENVVQELTRRYERMK